MAEKKVPENPTPDSMGGWKEGTSGGQIGENRRDEPNSIVSPAGWYTLNVEATGILDKVARARNITDRIYHIKYYTNAAQNKVGYAPVTTTGKGVCVIRRYAKKGGGSPRITFYQPGPFKEVPELKPSGKERCVITLDTNPYDGLPMLIVALKGVPVQTRRRKKKQATPAVTTAAAQTPPEGEEQKEGE